MKIEFITHTLSTALLATCRCIIVEAAPYLERKRRDLPGSRCSIPMLKLDMFADDCVRNYVLHEILNASVDDANTFSRRLAIKLDNHTYHANQGGQSEFVSRSKGFVIPCAKHHTRNKKPVEFVIQGDKIPGHLTSLYGLFTGRLALLSRRTLTILTHSEINTISSRVSSWSPIVALVW
jgi:hypothetical protein